MKNDVFHAHLDTCKRCRERPFDLCPIGQKAIRQAVDDQRSTTAKTSDE